MKRLLVTAALGAAVVLSAAPVAAGPPQPGGPCDGAVDAGCRERPCDPDELDCGMQFCVVWVAGGCVLRTA